MWNIYIIKIDVYRYDDWFCTIKFITFTFNINNFSNIKI